MQLSFLSLLLFVVVFSGCGRLTPVSPATAPLPKFPTNAIVYVENITVADETPAKADPETDCRAHIKTVMCVADRLNDDSTPVACEAGSDAYATDFETLYDNLPPAFQQMFCSLRIVYVLKEFEATAFAGTAKDADGNPNGAVMGIRKSLMDTHFDLSTWATWKEQLSFGGNYDSYEPKPELPHVTASTKVEVNQFLYMVVTHEFGHMFDFGNELNKVADDCPESTEANPDPICKFAAGSWGSLTWQDTETPSAANRFPFRPALCFYSCGDEAMTKAAVPDLYTGLTKSGFISTYAATNPWDDFAETIAYLAMQRHLNAVYQIDTMQGATYDMIGRLDSKELEQKRAYVELFLSRTDIKYP